MNTQYAGKLATIVALLGTLYIPQAMADETVTMGVLGTVAAGSKFFDNAIKSGSFTDTFLFSVNHVSQIAGSLSSSYQFVTGHGSAASFALGESITSASLIDLTTNHTTDLTVALTAPTHRGPYTIYADSASFASPVYLKAGDNYELLVKGVGGSTLTNVASLGHYNSAISINPVPEPEEWAMMLLGLPLMAWAARRKQASQTNATSLVAA